MVIENFSTLSQEELKQFAKKLVDKINTEKIITTEADFAILNDPDAVWASDITGNLIINLAAVEVASAVDASWAAAEDDPYDYDDAEEDSPDFEDVFKKEVVVDGYKVTLSIDDYDRIENLEVEVNDYSHEDSGIGHYEFWGQTGYDSHPYLEVSGTFINLYSAAVSLTIEPAETNK